MSSSTADTNNERQALLQSSSSNSIHRQTSNSQNSHAHRPHHLKYGDSITTSGFTPQLDEDDEEEISHFQSICRGAVDISVHRRKMRRDKTREILDAEARRIHAGRRYLIRKPRPHQYFRGKILVRSDEERTSSRLELFFDLTFVGLIAVLAKQVAHHPNVNALIVYLITYTGSFMIWTWMREIFNSFSKDDIAQRSLVMFVMICLVIFGNNAPRVDQDLNVGPGRVTAVLSYLAAEAAIFAAFFYYSFHIKAYRLQLRIHTLCWLVAAAIWLSTIFVSFQIATILSLVAVCLEYAAWNFVYSPTFKRLARLRYGSALNIEHELERFSDFFTLVMGEFLFSVFNNAPAGLGLTQSTGRAVMVVVIAFAFQMFYMLGGSSKKLTHPIRRSGPTAMLFFIIHIPLVCALTLCGDFMAELVVDARVGDAYRWFACGTYAVGMVCLWALAIMEKEHDGTGELWVPRWARVLPRLICAVIAALLPLTNQRAEHEVDVASMYNTASVLSDITTTKLLAILTVMSSITLLWEQITSLDGPNAPYECASDELLSAATDAHPTREALATPKWGGFPALVEPGAWTIDRSHQTDRDMTDLTPQVSRDVS